MLDCFEAHYYRLNRHIREESRNKTDLVKMRGSVPDYVSIHFFEEAPLGELFPFARKLIDLDLVRSWAQSGTRNLSQRQVIMGQWLNTVYAWTLGYMNDFYGQQLIDSGYVAANSKDIQFNLSASQSGVRKQGRLQLIDRLKAMGCGRAFVLLEAEAWPLVEMRTAQPRRKRPKVVPVPIDDLDPAFKVLGGGQSADGPSNNTDQDEADATANMAAPDVN